MSMYVTDAAYVIAGMYFHDLRYVGYKAELTQSTITNYVLCLNVTKSQPFYNADNRPKVIICRNCLTASFIEKV